MLNSADSILRTMIGAKRCIAGERLVQSEVTTEPDIDLAGGVVSSQFILVFFTDILEFVDHCITHVQ